MTSGFDEHGLVYTTVDYLHGAPIVLVYHELDGDWQYLTPSEGPPGPDDARLVHQGHIHESDPTLDVLLAMDKGIYAERLSPDHEWVIREDDSE